MNSDRTGAGFRQNKLKPRCQSASEELESDLVTPRTGTATTDTRDITGITLVATIAITGATHTIELITTLGGRTTTAAIDITNITSVTTAIKANRLV